MSRHHVICEVCVFGWFHTKTLCFTLAQTVISFIIMGLIFFLMAGWVQAQTIDFINDYPKALSHETRTSLNKLLDEHQKVATEVVYASILGKTEGSLQSAAASEFEKIETDLGITLKNGALIVLDIDRKRTWIHLGFGLTQKISESDQTLWIEELNQRLEDEGVEPALEMGVIKILKKLESPLASIQVSPHAKRIDRATTPLPSNEVSTVILVLLLTVSCLVFAASIDRIIDPEVHYTAEGWIRVHPVGILIFEIKKMLDFKERRKALRFEGGIVNGNW